MRRGLAALTVLVVAACAGSPSRRPAEGPPPGEAPTTGLAPAATVARDRAEARQRVQGLDDDAYATRRQCELLVLHVDYVRHLDRTLHGAPRGEWMRDLIQEARRESRIHRCMTTLTQRDVDCVMRARDGFDLERCERFAWP